MKCFLAGYSLWDLSESDMIESMHTHTQNLKKKQKNNKSKSKSKVKNNNNNKHIIGNKASPQMIIIQCILMQQPCKKSVYLSI